MGLGDLVYGNQEEEKIKGLGDLVFSEENIPQERPSLIDPFLAMRDYSIGKMPKTETELQRLVNAPIEAENLMEQLGSAPPQPEPKTLGKTLREAAKVVPYGVIQTIRGATQPFMPVIEGGVSRKQIFPVSKTLEEAAQYWKPDIGTMPNVEIIPGPSGWPTLKATKADIGELYGETMAGLGSVIAPIRAAVTAGKLITELPTIVQAVRPVYRNILSGMIAGGLTGEGKVDQTLENAAMFAMFEATPHLSGIPEAIRKSNIYRKATIKERGLMLQNLDDVIRNNPEMTQGEILRRWPNLQKEALAARSAIEGVGGKPSEGLGDIIFKEPGAIHGTLPEPIEPTLTRGEYPGRIAVENVPLSPEIAQRTQIPPGPPPPGLMNQPVETGPPPPVISTKSGGVPTTPPAFQLTPDLIEILNAEGEKVGAIFNGMQERANREPIAIFTDKKTGSTFGLEWGESITDKVEQVREKFMPPEIKKPAKEEYKEPESLDLIKTEKQPWEMSFSEWIKQPSVQENLRLQKERMTKGNTEMGIAQADFKNIHHVKVLRALEEGLPVPEKVLAEYPELKFKAESANIPSMSSQKGPGEIPPKETPMPEGGIKELPQGLFVKETPKLDFNGNSVMFKNQPVYNYQVIDEAGRTYSGIKSEKSYAIEEANKLLNWKPKTTKENKYYNDLAEKYTKLADENKLPKDVWLHGSERKTELNLDEGVLAKGSHGGFLFVTKSRENVEWYANRIGEGEIYALREKPGVKTFNLESEKNLSWITSRAIENDLDGYGALYEQRLKYDNKKSVFNSIKEDLRSTSLSDDNPADTFRDINNFLYENGYGSLKAGPDKVFFHPSESLEILKQLPNRATPPGEGGEVVQKPATEIKPSPLGIIKEERGSISVKPLKETIENLSDSSPVFKKKKEAAKRILQGFSEEIQSPERVLSRDPAGKKSYELIDKADQQKNGFLSQEGEKFQKASGKIKKDSLESSNVGKALDGKLDPSKLTPEENKLYEFLKKEYDYLINRYARQSAGSEEAFLRMQELANRKERPKLTIDQFEQLPEIVANRYNTLKNQANRIRKDKKLSELDPKMVDEYWKTRDQMKDFSHQEWLKTLPEGEREAYLALSRRIKEYLPHIFDPDILLENFKSEIWMIEGKLKTATNQSAITSLKTRLKDLEDAVIKLQNGYMVTYESLPRNVRFRFFETRKGKEGYSFDAMKSFQSYITGIARKMYDEPAIKQSAELHKEINPALKDYHKWYLRHYMGWDHSKLEPLSNAIASFEWMRTLGFNPRSALVNLTQHLNTITEVGEKASFEGERLGFTKKGTALFNATGIAKEVPMVLMEGPGSESLEKIRAISGILFRTAELANRKHAFLSGYSKAKSKGKSDEDAIEYGIKVCHKTQFRYGRVGMPRFLTRPGGRLLGQFSSYSIKQVELLADWTKNNPIKLIKYFGYALGLTITAQQLLNIDLSNAIGFVSNYGELIDSVKHIPEGDWRGALRHARVAFTGGVGILPSGPGPVVSGTIKVAQGISESRGIQNLKKELTPVVYSRIKQAAEAITDRKGNLFPIKDRNGHIMYNLTGPELGMRTLGPKTYTESRHWAETEGSRLLEQERKAVLKEITSAIIDNDKTKINKLTKMYHIFPSEESIYNEIMKRNIPPEQRPKTLGIREAYQLQREGRLYR